MRKLLFISFMIMLASGVNSQRLSIGITSGVDISHHYFYKKNVISPLDIPEYFFVNFPDGSPEKYKYWGFFDNRHSSFSFRFGPVLRFSYKRFSLRLNSTFQYSVDRMSFIEIWFDGEKSSFEQDFNFHSIFFENNGMITFDLQKKATAFYLIAGASMVNPLSYSDGRAIYDYSSQTLPYMYNIAYNEFAYNNLKFGIGKKFTKMDWNILYSRRMDYNTVDLDILISKLELNVNFYFKPQQTQKGHYLFTE